MFGRTVAASTALALAATACSAGLGVSESTSAPVDAQPGSRTGETLGTATEPDRPTTGGAGGTDDEPLPVFVPEPLEWNDFNDDVDVAVLEVPIDYAEPDGGTFELFIARHRALDPDRRIGSLLVNPGGPGFGGSVIALSPTLYFDERLLERFDVIGWDPRGTGESNPPIDCIDDYDPYFTVIDSTPETEDERLEMVAIAERFAEACVANNASTYDHVGTNASARDMDTIRRALGEDRISYFGFSYGSELGATWATLFPDTVRAAVLDGAADPDADALESNLQQQRGFQRSLETFLAQCDADADCVFRDGGDATAAFVDLMAELDADPLTVDPGRPPVNRDVAIGATFEALYAEWRWPLLRDALAAAADGDGTGLLELYDSYFERRPDGSYDNALEAFQVISCADTADRPTVAEADADIPLFVDVAPLLVPEGSIASYFCTFFPPPSDPRIEITGAGAGPIVVIGTTGDPATPFDSTVRMSDALDDGRLVIVEAERHGGYAVNQCVIDVVNDYLIDLEAPADGTECR